MSENKILASVSASLDGFNNGIKTMSENMDNWAVEFRYRFYLENLLEQEIAVMETALKIVNEKAQFKEKYQALIDGMDAETRKIIESL